ncbi:MAG TPA: alpha-amylase family protein [Actinomycetota bacterium]|nr:alpha-amylase family protein [Actinomycetota bacterium]
MSGVADSTAAVGGWWEDWPWRLIQTNLREIDMRDIDAERYVASLRSFDATVALINTSGIVASYPTALDFHTPSRYLQGDDLATIVAACHDAGIKVIARTDFSKVRRALYERHPEWAAVRADGAIVDEHGDVHVCVNGAYQREHAPAIVEETITSLDVDGIYFNWAGYLSYDYRGVDHGICHCLSCGERFAAMFDLQLPAGRDLDDPVYRRYLVFQDRTLREDRARMHERLRQLRPDLAVDRAFPAGGFVRQESNTALGRRVWAYSASDNTKWVVASDPRMVSSNASVDFIDFPVRHVAVSPHLQRLRLAQALANGGGLDYYVIGRLEDKADRSGFEGVREIFRFQAAHEDAYRDLTSRARIALLTGSRPDIEEHRGWFRVLAEHHFLFDVLAVDAADDAALARYGAIVIPGLEPIAGELARRLDAWVERGGRLVVSGLAGFRDEEYEPRDTPPFVCLGLERVREVRPEQRGAYFRIDVREGFGRLADTELLYLDGPYVDAEYGSDVTRRLSLIPPGPFGPPERVVLEEPTGEPAMTTRGSGDGRAIFLPWRCGALVERDGHPNTSDFLADVLQRHAELEPLGGNLSSMVEVTLFERPNGDLLLHLVNASGHFGQRELAPVRMHDAEVILPFEGEPVSVTALVGKRCTWSPAEGRLTVRMPELGLFEALVIAR